MRGPIFFTILATMLFDACSSEEECKFCGEWVLISSNGEELIEYTNIMKLETDGTFEFVDSSRSTSGNWATFDSSSKIIFSHRYWLKPVKWTAINLVGDTLHVSSQDGFNLILIRKTEKNATVLEAGLTRIDEFNCAGDSTTIPITYETSGGRKNQLEFTTYCARDKFFTIKDPFKKNKVIERHFYHYSNTAAVFRFSSTTGDKEFWVDRNSFLDSLRDENSHELLLQSISYNDYPNYEGFPSLLPSLILQA